MSIGLIEGEKGAPRDDGEPLPNGVLADEFSVVFPRQYPAGLVYVQLSAKRVCSKLVEDREAGVERYTADTVSDQKRLGFGIVLERIRDGKAGGLKGVLGTALSPHNVGHIPQEGDCDQSRRRWRRERGCLPWRLFANNNARKIAGGARTTK